MPVVEHPSALQRSRLHLLLLVIVVIFDGGSP
jgi:hypothetical protein